MNNNTIIDKTETTKNEIVLVSEESIKDKIYTSEVSR